MINFLRKIQPPSKEIETLLPLDIIRVKESLSNLRLYQSKRLNTTYIFAHPFCKTEEIQRCKAVLQNERTVWLILPFLSWKRQQLIEEGSQTKCYFYQVKKGKWTVFDRRRIDVKGKNYTTHPFSLHLDKPYQGGLKGDFAYRMKTHKNFAKAINKKIAMLGESPPLWKCLKQKNTYKTSLSALYEFLLKKLEC